MELLDKHPDLDVIVVTDPGQEGDAIRETIFSNRAGLDLIGFLVEADGSRNVTEASVLNVIKSYDAAIFKALIDYENGVFSPGAVYIDTAFGAFQLSNITVNGDVEDSFYLQGTLLI
jgi:hypothetical protein